MFGSGAAPGTQQPGGQSSWNTLTGGSFAFNANAGVSAGQPALFNVSNMGSSAPKASRPMARAHRKGRRGQ
jgi:hypothetical protein